MAVHTWSVEELCAGISLVLADAFPDQCWVRGEIRGLRRTRPGHVYFDLVQHGATGRGNDPTMSIVAFRGPLQGIEAVLRKVGDLRLEDGLDVRIRGRVEFYAPHGRVQFMMNAIDPRHTLGQLSSERDAALRTLAAEGLLDRNRQLEAPLVPLRIGLVTSAGSAAHHDFVGELRQTTHDFQVFLADTRVQGLDAHDMIAESIRRVDAYGVDVIAVVRGGGSRGDLIAFDQLSVARAIAEASVPVHVGVGHDIDLSVADQIAHQSWKTPTACAAALVEQVSSFRRQLDVTAARVAEATRRQLDASRRESVERARRMTRAATHAVSATEHLHDLRRSRLATNSRRVLAIADTALVGQATELRTAASYGLRIESSRLGDRRSRLAAAPLSALDRTARRVATSARVVRAMDPARTLERGYSITRTPDGRAITTADDVGVGETVVTELSVGQFSGTVTTVAAVSTPAERNVQHTI